VTTSRVTAERLPAAGVAPAVGTRGPHAGAARAVVGLAATIGLVGLFAAWFVWFRPQILGGPAAYVLVGGTSMEPHVEPGTLVILVRAESYAVGDVVAYRIPDGDPAAGRNVIHRIVGGDANTGFLMQGDNTNATDIWRPTPQDVIGREWLVLPDAATALLFLRSPAVVAAVAAALASYLVLAALSPRSTRAARSMHQVAPNLTGPRPRNT